MVSGTVPRTRARARRVAALGVAILAALGDGAGCAQVVRVRRVLAPEVFVTPEAEVGRLGELRVDPGWRGQELEPYDPPRASIAGEAVWLDPVPVTDRGSIELWPARDDVAVALYTRHVGLVQRDFQRLLARSGTIPGELETGVRFLPTGPLGGAPLHVELRDLVNVYSDDRLLDGDLLLVEVNAPNAAEERYLFRLYDFGWRTRAGAGLLLRLPIPFVESGTAALTPALTASLAIGYRPATQNPAANFLTEQLAVVVSVGVGSTVLEEDGLDDQLSSAFNAALVGGGIDVLQMFTLQILGNASAPFRDDQESGWALAVGFDAVQFARFADHLGARLLREHPLAEERRRR